MITSRNNDFEVYKTVQTFSFSDFFEAIISSNNSFYTESHIIIGLFFTW
jgi:hypothetical protein